MTRRLITGASAAAFAAAMAVVYRFAPTEHGFYPRCPFYMATHLLCPGCGATRALYALLHGNLGAALHYNAMFTLLAPFLLAWGLFCCYTVLRYDRLPPGLRIPPLGMAAMGVAALLFTITRNIFFAL